jgi:hypothetical protein
MALEMMPSLSWPLYDSSLMMSSWPDMVCVLPEPAGAQAPARGVWLQEEAGQQSVRRISPC